MIELSRLKLFFVTIQTLLHLIAKLGLVVKLLH